MISECHGCGTKWSDGRAFCDHTHCGRADLPGTLRTLRRKHYKTTKRPIKQPKLAAEQPKTPRIIVHRIK